VFAERREGDPLRSLADIRRASEELGYEPTIKLRDGLIKLVDHLRSE
jgi:nucleoside-diphosphate-sugar epimerase